VKTSLADFAKVAKAQDKHILKSKGLIIKGEAAHIRYNRTTTQNSTHPLEVILLTEVGRY